MINNKYPMINAVLALALVSSFVSADAYAQTEPESGKKIDEIVVFGRGLQQVGEASAASEGTVSGADLAIRPLLQVAELLEVVPGMVAVQHSGSGKANQYFLRGFNLDHGTDFANYVDSVPINIRSHGHGQGYLDVNGLISETVDRIDYRKGTYRADSGDFSIAGASYMTTIDRLDQSFVSVEGGSYDYQRYALGGTIDLGKGSLTTISQYKVYDGPWELSEELDHKSIWSKYTQELDAGKLNVSLSGYSADWRPTEQIPESAIGTEVCEDEFCSLEDNAFGETDRWIANILFQSDNWEASFYAQYYDWQMSSNPTYDEQINQFDKRTIFGGHAEYNFKLSDSLNAMVGTELRYDDVSRVGVDFFEEGQFLAPNGDNELTEGSVAAYTELQYQTSDALRLIAGLRADYYDFDVTALNSTSVEGSETDAVLSPKLIAAYAFNDNVEAYANWGYGFHSNDARGVVNELDPVDGLVRGEGYELGVRYDQANLKFSATYWWLNLDSELIFVGDSNTVEPRGGSEREGLELVAFWNPLDWLAFDAVYATSDARFTDPEAEGGEFIDQSLEDSGSFGMTVNYGSWDVSARLRYFGEYALVPDNSERADGLATINVRVARQIGDISIYGEIINLTDDDGKDIVYFYETNVEGLGINEGRVSRAKEPRTFRVGLRYHF